MHENAAFDHNGDIISSYEQQSVAEPGAGFLHA